MNKWLILIAGAGILTLGALSFARPGPGRPEHGGEGMLARALDNPKMMEKLGLDSAQVKSLRELGYEAKKRHITLRAEAAQARLDIHRLLSKDEPNEDAVMSAIDQAGQAATALHKSHVKHMLEGRALVGSETWQKVRQMLRRKGHKGPRSMHHRDGRRPGSGPGPGHRQDESSRPSRHRPSFNPGRRGPENEGGIALDIATDMQADMLNEPVLEDWPEDAPINTGPESLFPAEDKF